MTLADYRVWASSPIQSTAELSIVIPTYNEEWRILPTIGAIATHVSSMGIPWELIIADDGSTDTTIELIQALDLANLHLLVAEHNGGKGSAVRRGVQAASGKYVLFADADQSTPIEQLDLLLAEIQTGGADIAIGSRATAGANVESKGLARKVLSRGLRSIIRLLFPIRIEDTQCGFKLFSAESAQDLFGLQRIDGFSFDLEVLYLAHKRAYDVVEVPVSWIDAPGSTVESGKVAVQFLRDLVLVRTNDMFGRYGRRDETEHKNVGPPAETTEGADTWRCAETELTPVSYRSEGDSMQTNAMSSVRSSTD